MESQASRYQRVFGDKVLFEMRIDGTLDVASTSKETFGMTITVYKFKDGSQLIFEGLTVRAKD